jgi:two-component system chemotaxis response regulator CheY
MKSILLIDDEEDVRDSVRKVLELAGFRVVTASNGKDGIAAAEAADFDLVISDIIMPGLNGVDVIKAIRRLRPAARILGISGGGSFGVENYRPDAITTTAYLEAAIHAGADGLLTKPFERMELLKSVHELLGSQDQS